MVIGGMGGWPNLDIELFANCLRLSGEGFEKTDSNKDSSMQFLINVINGMFLYNSMPKLFVLISDFVINIASPFTSYDNDN